MAITDKVDALDDLALFTKKAISNLGAARDRQFMRKRDALLELMRVHKLGAGDIASVTAPNEERLPPPAVSHPNIGAPSCPCEPDGVVGFGNPSGLPAPVRGPKLAAYSTKLRTIMFRSRDPALRSGKTITLSLGAPTNQSGDFLIQRVISSEFDTTEGLMPMRDVIAAPVLVSFRDVLRRQRAA